MREEVLQRSARVPKPLKRTERLQRQPALQELPAREELVRLFAKYDVQAPRYTSYPPATLFHTGFTAQDHSTHLTSLRGTSGGGGHEQTGGRPEVSLYVHLPFCDTLCFFCGCTMLISNNREKIAEYLGYLKREITMVREKLAAKGGPEPVVVQMHWGGGSPTHLTPDEIRELGEHLHRQFTFAPDAEVSIEIDPRGLTREHVEAMQAVGFDRASIGVQDLAPDVQVAINRVQPQEITEQVIGWCRELGLQNINLDLIYGLPYQTTESFRATLEVAHRELRPDRLAIYSFAYVPWIKPHQKLIPLEIVPPGSHKLALLELAVREMRGAGYEYLGMDHFALPEDTLAQAQREGTLHRNFQGYSTHAGTDLIAFGISGISRLGNAFAQNVKELEPYYAAIDAGLLPTEKGYALNADDRVREHVIMKLMCDLSLETAELTHAFGLPSSFEDTFAGALAALEEPQRDGLVEIHEGAITVTGVGRYFLRNIAAAFDGYLTGAPAQQRYSRTL